MTRPPSFSQRSSAFTVGQSSCRDAVRCIRVDPPGEEWDMNSVGFMPIG